MIKEVIKCESDFNNWYDVYTVHYTRGRQRKYYGHDLPRSVRDFISAGDTESMFVSSGLHKYFKR